QQSDILQEASVPIISNAVCNQPEYYNNQITGKMFCAGYSDGGLTPGDSGGPFVCEDTISRTSRWRLCGIVSWGIGCALPNKPGVYAKVDQYQSWIYRAMKLTFFKDFVRELCLDVDEKATKRMTTSLENYFPMKVWVVIKAT
ncbi:unnamed protein product, partial [Ranitomeya imitator]